MHKIVLPQIFMVLLPEQNLLESIASRTHHIFHCYYMHISWIHICHCNYVESFFLQVITTSHSRTWRISIFEAALTLGLVAGSMTSGLIIDHLDLPALFGITAGKIEPTNREAAVNEGIWKVVSSLLVPHIKTIQSKNQFFKLMTNLSEMWEEFYSLTQVNIPTRYWEVELINC